MIEEVFGDCEKIAGGIALVIEEFWLTPKLEWETWGEGTAEDAADKVLRASSSSFNCSEDFPNQNL